MPGRGGTPSEVRSKKKRRPHRFFGEVVFGTTFFFTMTFSLNSPRPACDAKGAILAPKGAEKQRIMGKMTVDFTRADLGPRAVGTQAPGALGTIPESCRPVQEQEQVARKTSAYTIKCPKSVILGQFRV